jgi:acyl-CoA thioesterase-1
MGYRRIAMQLQWPCTSMQGRWRIVAWAVAAIVCAAPCLAVDRNASPAGSPGNQARDTSHRSAAKSGPGAATGDRGHRGQANAQPIRVVAIGASNTSGWLLGQQMAYPAVLETMLKVRGISAKVINAGVPFDTTSRMLARIETDVPDGTDIVILQPGGNDLRFFGSREQRTANIEAMRRRLQARSIHAIVYDEEIPWRYVYDGIHLTSSGHKMVAAALLPQVISLVNKRQAGSTRLRPRPESRASRAQ